MDYLQAPIDEMEIDRAHRTGKKYQDNQGKWQQPVLLKFNSWSSRNRMYNLRKDSHLHMKADLTVRNESVLNYAKDQIGQPGSSANKYVKYAYADRNCTLTAFTSTGRFLKFTSEFEFDMLILNIENTTRLSDSIYDTIGNDWESLHPGE